MKLESIFNYINFLIGSTTSVCIKLLGGEDYILQFLLLLMITEYFTGLFLSLKKIQYKNRQERFLNIVQKIAMLWIIVLGVYADQTFGLSNQMINSRNTLISFFIGFEGLTVIENYATIGIKIPIKFKEIFINLTNNK